MQVMAKEWVDWGLLMSGTGIHWSGRGNTSKNEGTDEKTLNYRSNVIILLLPSQNLL